MPTGNPVVRVLDWLRAGYPEGVPPTDYFPLIALLQRQQMSEDEIRAIAHEVVFKSGGEPISETDIGELITKVTNELPHPEDVARVSTRLVAGGWPLADPH
ncbi:hypothetical protein GCM10011519_09680 [Marmoricola endophyticus]|uniref:DUF3349 domain-containing protein n=1 Tax=Marmoricola endophyticus TaxID=2040280 RepID=A0A917BDV9_9ACTN|nr:DUF3349 domain-containing protein [Marmoricola endophyticus]GGF38178.1 hypothetical protein GCM10011519_09680 [Marmoricola endophyticus]